MERLPTHEQKVNDIAAIKNKLGCTKLSFAQYRDAGGRFTKGQIYSNGDTWGELCAEAGTSMDDSKAPVSNDVYFAKLKKFVDEKGRLPKTSERTLAGLNFQKSRWPTLSLFIDEAVSKGVIEASYRKLPVVPESEPKASLPTSLPPSGNNAPTGVPCQPIRGVPPIPSRSKRRTWKRIDVPGFPYAPQDEQGVVALFAILCNRGDRPWQILDVNGGKGIDAVCWDDDRNAEFRVEFKYVLSKQSWNHSLVDLDLVVCWLNKWPDFPKPVLELSKLLSQK